MHSLCKLRCSSPREVYYAYGDYCVSYFLNQKSRCASVSTGVYLTEKSLQILQLESRNSRYYITNFRRFFITNDFKHNILIIKKLRKFNLSSLEVSLAIPDSLTLRKNIKVSKKLNTAELTEIARLESKKYLLNGSDGICFDYSLTEHKDQNEYYKMLIVAAKYSVIKTKISFLNTLGLEVKRVDVESNCILRVVKNLNDIMHLTIAWFHLSENTIKTFVLKGNEVVFMNEEKYIKSKNQTDLTEIYTKIERALLYYYPTIDAGPIELIYLSGSYPELSGLRQMLASKKHISVDVLDNFMPTDTLVNVCKSVMALGMALV